MTSCSFSDDLPDGSLFIVSSVTALQNTAGKTIRLGMDAKVPRVSCDVRTIYYNLFHGIKELQNIALFVVSHGDHHSTPVITS
jgi:hypothetical protein